MGVVKLGDVARESRLKWTKSKQDVPMVGLEHLIPDEIRFDAYDINTDNTFSKRFVKGQVLFGRRRAYQRKAAVAEFDGICSGDITVIEAIEGKMVPELLPFIIQTPVFFDYANRGSAGSLSPRVKWEHLAEYEVELPPLEEQKVLADKLWAAYRLKEAYKKLLVATDEMVKSQFIEMFGNIKKLDLLKNHCSICSGKSIPTKYEDEFGNIAYVKVSDFNLRDNEKYIRTSSKFVSQRVSALSKQINKGCVIFAKNGAASLSNKKRLTEIECCIDMNTMSVECYDGTLVPLFLFSVFESINIASYVRQGAVPSINPNDIGSIEIPIPSISSQNEFITIVKQADKSKFELKQCIENIDKVIKSLING